jgi:hypothetical protein
MKLFHFILALAAIAAPEFASANNQENSQSSDHKSIFGKFKGEKNLDGFAKSESYLDGLLLTGTSDKFTSTSSSEHQQQFSLNSFQSMVEPKFNSSATDSELSFKNDSAKTGTNYYSNSAFNVGDRHIEIAQFDEHFRGRAKHENDWEDHHVTTPVPEPKAWELMFAGLLALGFVKRKKN